MKKNLAILGLCAVLAAPLPALAADNPAYTYVDGRIVQYDPDGPGSLDGIRFGGSYLFDPSAFAFGSYTTVSDGPFDLSFLEFGAGLRNSLKPGTDLVGSVAIVLADADTGGLGGSDSDTGISLTGGVRSLLGPKFEVGGYANYAEIFGDGDISLIGEALLHVTREVSLAASLSVSDDVDILTIGGRWNFHGGRR